MEMRISLCKDIPRTAMKILPAGAWRVPFPIADSVPVPWVVPSNRDISFGVSQGIALPL